MDIYIILLILALCLILFSYDIKYNMYVTSVVCFVFIILFFVGIFRSYSVGTDYRMYHNVFMYYTYDDMVSDSMESGFAHLETFAQSLNTFWIVPAFVLIIIGMSIYLLNRQFHVNRFSLLSFFILTGLYFQSFSALRQICAIGIVYIGIYFLFKYESNIFIGIFLFLLCVYVAHYFHRSAIFSLFFLILPYISYSKKTVYFFGVFTTFLFLIGNSFDDILMKMVPFYGNRYVQNMYNINSFGNTSQLIPIIIQFIFLYMFVSNNSINSSKDKFILSGYLLYLFMFSFINNNAFRRFQIYTFIFPMLYSCLFINGINLRGKIISKMKRSNKLEYICFWIILYMFKLFSNKSALVPYSIL